MKKAKTVPNFKSIEEIAKFWDTHSTADYPDYWQPAPDVKVSKDLESVYIGGETINFDKETVKSIKKVALKKRITTSTAARMLIRERLDQLKII